jgi:hypothetical protein
MMSNKQYTSRFKLANETIIRDGVVFAAVVLCFEIKAPHPSIRTRRYQYRYPWHNEKSLVGL